MSIAFPNNDLNEAEAASLLAWWMESGVDVATAEAPRNWLKPVADVPAATVAATAAAAETAPSVQRHETLESFHAWMAEASDLPLFRTSAKRVLPAGVECAPVMLLSDIPGPEEAGSGKPIAGQAAILAGRMLEAIGIAPDAAYMASLSCFPSPGSRISSDDLDRCGALAREQVRLAKPERLILFGDAPARALTGQPLAATRGRVHRVEGIRTIATFHPRWLLQRSSDKALAWRDLLLLMSEEG